MTGGDSGRNMPKCFFEEKKTHSEIADLIVGGSKKIFNVTVTNLGHAVEMLKSSGFYVDERIGDFEMNEEVGKEVQIKIVGFNRRVTYDMAKRCFKSRGLRSATFGAVPPFGLKYKRQVEHLTENLNFLAALGSECAEFGRIYIPFFGRHFKKPALLRHWVDFGFGPHWRFLVECEL
jgi:hypothetical protein